LARPPMIEGSHHQNRVLAVDDRKVKNPVSYWLDRPARKPRPAAIVLARRIMREAGVASEAAEDFIAAET
jgi:LysR family glycine cleavage system transcriptional activator